MYRALATTFTEEKYEVAKSEHPIQVAEYEKVFNIVTQEGTIAVPKSLVKDVEVYDEPDIDYFSPDDIVDQETVNKVFIVDVHYYNSEKDQVSISQHAFGERPTVFQTDKYVQYSLQDNSIKIFFSPDIRVIHASWRLVDEGTDDTGSEISSDDAEQLPTDVQE